MSQAPQHVGGNPLIFVAQDVADVSDLLPWNFRVTRLQLVGQPAAGFGNDLDAALDQPALAPIRLEHVKRHTVRLGLDMPDGLDDVGEARDGRRALALEDLQRRSFDLRPQHRMQAGPCHDVGAAAENAGGGIPDIHQPEQAQRTARVIEEQIHIRILVRVTARRRAEQVQMLDAKPPQFGFVFFKRAMASSRFISGNYPVYMCILSHGLLAGKLMFSSPAASETAAPHH